MAEEDVDPCCIWPVSYLGGTMMLHRTTFDGEPPLCDLLADPTLALLLRADRLTRQDLHLTCEDTRIRLHRQRRPDEGRTG